MKSALASSMFGKVKRRLKSGQIQHHLSFKQVQGEATQAICRAKNKWFQAKAEEAEKELFGGKKLWQCIRSM